MATLTKTSASRWKAVVRRNGWPTSARTWRTKRDAEDWARRTEDEMARGVFKRRAPAEQMTLSVAVDRYLSEVTPTKKASTETGDKAKSKKLRAALGQYSLVAITPDVVRCLPRPPARREPIPRHSTSPTRPALPYLRDCDQGMAYWAMGEPVPRHPSAEAGQTA